MSNTMPLESDSPITTEEGDITIDAVAKFLESRAAEWEAALQQPDAKKHLEQKHYLNPGTAERASWQAGYLSALRYAIKLLQERTPEQPAPMPSVQPSSPRTERPSAAPAPQD